jgi:hypothetical protein
VVLFRDGRIVKDFPVAERRNATQAILDLPDLDEEDGEDDAAK